MGRFFRLRPLTQHGASVKLHSRKFFGGTTGAYSKTFCVDLTSPMQNIMAMFLAQVSEIVYHFTVYKPRRLFP